jgi:glycosyltransferase involved in cell wall biosynthesis
MSPPNRRVMLLTHAGGSPHHGPNMRWYYLGQALKEHGIQVDIVSSSSFHKYINPPTISRGLETQEIDGLNYHWIKTAPYKGRGLHQVRNQVEFVARTWRYAGQLSQHQPDIVVASSPHPFVVYPAVSIARRSKARFFYEVRDLWPAILLELGSFSKRHPYILANKAAEAYAVKRAEKVLSVKPGDFEYFAQEYSLTEDRFAYIPNGFLPDDRQSVAPDSIQSLRRRYDIVVGYAGAVSSYYSLEDMVELADQFRNRSDVGFIVVGGGNREKAIRELAEAKGLENFHMLGKIPKHEVPATLQLFDICYVGLEDLDIHKYGISCNKIYEYMHASKPILGSYVAGHDPVKAADCGISVRPGNPQELGAALLEMTENKTRRAELGEKGKRFFDQTHHFGRVAGELVQKVFDAS